ncbi:hypothetical protein HanHA300_Chr09g0320751 [Helianthus annuus]|nr:hypothetical protein HanHA300_Chr09g0320751 [Helianthus annuus]KAJ0542613.1 hypothetical protein HanHA89_Chr09g0341691 [Helianthus annuus]KAJ0707670.1 hypothetical protein HanLR1_Chr09g0321041 [Helianthus annuus]
MPTLLNETFLIYMVCISCKIKVMYILYYLCSATSISLVKWVFLLSFEVFFCR